VTQTQFVRRVLKPVVFLGCLAPFLWLAYGAVAGDLGANPVETITNQTGIWTLRLLVATIAITPIRWATKWNPIISFRRMIGLFAFFYATVHFLIYFILDRSLMLDGLWEDILLRPYITVGFAAFVLMMPLALTSTRGWIRRLGGQRWNLLHKLVYVSSVLGALHYIWKVKLDVTNPVVYAAIIAALLGWRVVKAIGKREARQRASQGSVVSERSAASRAPAGR
jgi:methionine sulfoxide reductase heme-binding subunit